MILDSVIGPESLFSDVDANCTVSIQSIWGLHESMGILII